VRAAPGILTLVAASFAASGAAACGGGDDGASGDGGVDGDNGPSAAEVFDTTVVRRFELTVAQQDLDRINAAPTAEEYVPANLRYGEVTLDNIAVRYKGSVGSLGLCFDGQGRRICPKLSMKLKFDEYVDGQRFAGLKRINLHAMYRDTSHMKDRIGYGLFRAAGVPAPRSAHARLVINGMDFGLFALVEEIDGEFVEDHFRDVDGTGDGNLYKEVWPVYTTEQPYRNALDTNEELNPPVDKMVRFATALNGANATTFRGVLGQWMDVPTVVSYLAVDRFIDSWDGIVAWYCPDASGPCFNHNYFWYEQADADRVWLIPWDLDNTMQQPSLMRDSYGMPDWNAPTSDCTLRMVFLGFYGRPPACDHFIGLMAQVLWSDYEARTAELIAGPASMAALEAEIAAMEALLAPEVATDMYGPGMAGWQQGVADLRADLPLLRARVTP
jgi:spore coat protein H